MRKLNAILLSAVAVSAAVAFVAEAQAQTRRDRNTTVIARKARPPLTIRQRSFLDSGRSSRRAA